MLDAAIMCLLSRLMRQTEYGTVSPFPECRARAATGLVHMYKLQIVGELQKSADLGDTSKRIMHDSDEEPFTCDARACLCLQVRL